MLRLRNLIVGIGLLAFTVVGNLTTADGPKDNLPDNVRPVPPRGATVSDKDLQELRAGLAELQTQLDKLKGNDLLPDVEIYHKAVRYAVEYNELYVDKNRNDVATAKVHLKTGLKRAQELLDGKPSWTQATGLVVRGYHSEIDGSVQPYGLVVPKEYDFQGLKPHRLDFWWHGRGELLTELDFIRGRERNAGEFTPPGAFVVHPYGRYCNANKMAGEVDSFEALDHIRKHYRIDDKRLVARGFSMGGAACWQYATHYPFLWAAAAPGAGFSETPEFLNIFQNEKVEPTWYERKLWHLYNASDYALNLFNLPTVAYSGEIDKQKQAADVMAREMKKVGLDLVHIIGPKTGHSYEKNAKAKVNELIDAIVEKGKEPFPKEMRFITYTLRYNQAGWVSVQGLKRHWEPATIKGKITNGAMTIETSGITELMLPIATFVKNGVKSVAVDGTTVWQTPAVSNEDSVLEQTIRRDGDNWKTIATQRRAKADRVVVSRETQLRKKPGLQGPIDDAFLSSFIMVTPSGKPMNEAIGKWVDRELPHAVEHWRKQFRGDARLKADRDITDEDLRQHNLILWGDPQSNSILTKISKQLPIMEFSDKTVQLLIYPNPLNPEKYVVLNSGFTFREYDYLNNARQVPKLPDYAVIDITTPANSRYPGTVVRAGFFDESWALQPNDGQARLAPRGSR